MDFSKNILPEVLDELYQRNIQTVLVEGGSHLLNTFIQYNLWNEARIFIAPECWGKGIVAPVLTNSELFSEEQFGDNLLRVMTFK